MGRGSVKRAARVAAGPILTYLDHRFADLHAHLEQITAESRQGLERNAAELAALEQRVARIELQLRSFADRLRAETDAVAELVRHLDAPAGPPADREG